MSSCNRQKNLYKNKNTHTKSNKQTNKLKTKFKKKKEIKKPKKMVPHPPLHIPQWKRNVFSKKENLGRP